MHLEDLNYCQNLQIVCDALYKYLLIVNNKIRYFTAEKVFQRYLLTF